jgi:hypothetical protein
MDIWGKKNSGGNINVNKDMEDVYKCMDALGAMEKM